MVAPGLVWGLSFKRSFQKIRRKKRAETALVAELESSCLGRAARPIRGIEVHSTARHDGRDGVFVNHLGNCIAKQYHVLIKRLNLSLQLDAVDQVNGHGYVLTPQDVQEGVLQQLAFVL
jgi:hypothetical protein